MAVRPGTVAEMPRSTIEAVAAFRARRGSATARTLQTPSDPCEPSTPSESCQHALKLLRAFEDRAPNGNVYRVSRRKVASGAHAILVFDGAGYAPIMLSIVFTASSVLLSLGVIGSYVWRTYENTKRRPFAIVQSSESFNHRMTGRSSAASAVQSSPMGLS